MNNSSARVLVVSNATEYVHESVNRNNTKKTKQQNNQQNNAGNQAILLLITLAHTPLHSFHAFFPDSVDRSCVSIF